MGKRHSRLKGEVLRDLTQNTKLTEEQIKELYKVFISQFPDGQIRVEDFKRIYGSFYIYASGDASMFAEHIFRTFDTNRDGIVDFREFAHAQSIALVENLDQKLKFAFTMYDVDGDGYITKQEMLEVVTAVYKAMGSAMKMSEDESTPEKRTDNIFRDMDKDKDGKLTLEEFMEGCKDNTGVLQMMFDLHGDDIL